MSVLMLLPSSPLNSPLDSPLISWRRVQTAAEIRASRRAAGSVRSAPEASGPV